MQKLLTCLQQNINIFENTLGTVNEFVINELVKITFLWTTGPWTFAQLCIPQYTPVFTIYKGGT